MLAIFLLLLGLLFAKPVFAGEPPTQTSPENNSTVSSSSLSWQAPSYPVCLTYSSYRVQVDDDPSFPSSSIYRNNYTKNTYYTPQLPLGTWYWRVMVRDATCNNWSDWSNVWSFTLQSEPSPTPTPTPTSTPTPSSTSAGSTSSSSSSSFTISNTPQQVNSNQAFTVSVNLSLPNDPNNTFYIKGAFKKVGSSNYFGLTKVGPSWTKNGASYSQQLSITTDVSGNWSGNLEIQPDSEDSGFEGTGDYIFKVGRYTSAGSGPTWSNESNIKIVSTVSRDQGGTLTSTANTTSSTINPSTTPSSVKNKIITSPKPKSYKELVYHTATVAAATASANPSPNVQVKSQRQLINIVPWIGGALIIFGIGSLIFIYLRNRKIS